jgi:hypothetical protein
MWALWTSQHRPLQWDVPPRVLLEFCVVLVALVMGGVGGGVGGGVWVRVGSMGALQARLNCPPVCPPLGLPAHSSWAEDPGGRSCDVRHDHLGPAGTAPAHSSCSGQDQYRGKPPGRSCRRCSWDRG